MFLFSFNIDFYTFVHTSYSSEFSYSSRLVYPTNYIYLEYTTVSTPSSESGPPPPLPLASVSPRNLRGRGQGGGGGVHHRVDRVLGFFSSRPNWDPLPPLPLESVSPPPEPMGEGIHSSASVGVECPKSDDWRKSLVLCLLCGVPPRMGLCIISAGQPNTNF